ncbi:alpha/beta hydrolase [Desertivirga xinjiangensis]|uniref:alpha/beta hydrolase n=1 Tax=Desertivirga xinjiangensis TaxID=539206 RepID=UPI00210C1F1A|nr:alpha/beta hydrolase [Pedobacter xinjiangensis]
MLRFILCLICLLVSCLAVLKAPTYHLWLVAILVTEFPVFLAGVIIVLLLWGIKVERFNLPGTLSAIIALMLVLSTPARAWLLAGDIKNDFSAGSSPISLKQLFSGKGTREVSPDKLSYVSKGDHLKINFFSAVSAGERPCIIVIHGGSWKSGNNAQLPELNSVLASEGYHVAAVNYHLAPKYQSPVQVDDIRSAFEYLKKHSKELRIDTSRFVLLGRSAGAQIALVSAYTMHERGIKGVIDFYGPADMIWGYTRPASPLVMDSRKVMEDYLGATLEVKPKYYELSSPIYFITADSPPTLIIHGENDVLVDYEHSRRLQNKLQESSVKNYFLSLPWATHGFDYNINGPGGQLSTFVIKKFLKDVTR